MSGAHNEALRAARTRAGLTVADAATQLGISPSALRSYERDKWPALESTRKRLAEFLLEYGCDPARPDGEPERAPGPPPAIDFAQEEEDPAAEVDALLAASAPARPKRARRPSVPAVETLTAEVAGRRYRVDARGLALLLVAARRDATDYRDGDQDAEMLARVLDMLELAPRGR